MSKKLKGVVIGPSGIGKAHIRELIHYGFKNICLIGKKFRKKRLDILEKEHRNTKFFNLKTISEVKKRKPKVINLCSPTKFHYDQILIIKNFCKILIIEKPIFWIKNKKLSNFKITKNLLKSQKNQIFVNLPMISLAGQIRKKDKIKKIERFDFNYFTKGKNKFENIPIDLLPHALSFLFVLNFNILDNFEILDIIKKKYSWKCKILINNCLCNFFFKQNFKRKNSYLSFKINNDFYVRKQFLRNNVYVNKLLKNKKKLINIKNPMSDYLNLIFKNFNKNNLLKNNNNITINSTQLMEKLINY